MEHAIIFLVVVAAAMALPFTGPGDYHQQIGIKLAKRIQQAEQAADFDGARIIGGSPAPIGAHPYMTGLIVFMETGDISVCGGSLLSNTRALTAAHCWMTAVSQAFQFTVVLGSNYVFTGGHRVNTSDVVLHPNYSTFGIWNDIAIVRFGWVPYTFLIQPISLPSGALLNESFANTWAQAIGFGRTGDGEDGAITPNQVLSEVYLRVISNEECSRNLPTTHSLLCTSGQGVVGVCSSDSGGPLTSFFNGQRIQIGVVSFGSGAGCESQNPAAYSRVTSFVPWIQANL